MKKLILETSYRDVELMETPGLVVVELSDSRIARVLELQHAVIGVGAYYIKEWDYSPVWTKQEEDDEGEAIPGEPLRTECDCLVVSTTEFWWSCYCKHTDVDLVSERVKIKELTPKEMKNE